MMATKTAVSGQLVLFDSFSFVVEEENGFSTYSKDYFRHVPESESTGCMPLTLQTCMSGAGDDFQAIMIAVPR